MTDRHLWLYFATVHRTFGLESLTLYGILRVLLKDFRIRWPVLYFPRSFPTHCIVNILYNFTALHCQHTPCPLAAVPLRRLTFYIVFILSYFLNCVPKITYLCSKLCNNETHTSKYTIMNLLYRRSRSAVL